VTIAVVLRPADDFKAGTNDVAPSLSSGKAEEASAAPSPAPESKEQPAGAAPALKVQLPKSTRSAASSAAPAAAKTPNRAPEDGGTFKLTATRPSKQRTGGKKAFRCAIL